MTRRSVWRAWGAVVIPINRLVTPLHTAAKPALEAACADPVVTSLRPN